MVGACDFRCIEQRGFSEGAGRVTIGMRKSLQETVDSDSLAVTKKEVREFQNVTKKLMRKNCVLSIIAALAAGFAVTSANAAAITPGDLVIYRVGDGSSALGTTATAVFLDEYTPLGSLVQSIVSPTTGVAAMTAGGNATTEGIISRSQDGNSLVFGGYRANVAAANPGAAAPGTVNRVIGTLNASGTLNTSIAVTDANGAMRSATTVDGSTYYISGASNVRYVGTPSGASTSTVIDARNSRQVNLSGNTVFAANGSTAITGKVQHYGTLPTGLTAATPVVSLATTDAVNGFALFDLNAGVAGDDTLYALSTVENLLRKYTFDGISWTASGSVAANSALNLAGYASGSTVNLYLTSSSTLFNFADASGYNAAINPGSFTTLATASANTGFRGIGLLVPEPTSLCLVAIGAGVALIRRRKV